MVTTAKPGRTESDWLLVDFSEVDQKAEKAERAIVDARTIYDQVIHPLAFTLFYVHAPSVRWAALGCTGLALLKPVAVKATAEFTRVLKEGLGR